MNICVNCQHDREHPIVAKQKSHDHAPDWTIINVKYIFSSLVKLRIQSWSPSWSWHKWQTELMESDFLMPNQGEQWNIWLVALYCAGLVRTGFWVFRRSSTSTPGIVVCQTNEIWYQFPPRTYSWGLSLSPKDRCVAIREARFQLRPKPGISWRPAINVARRQNYKMMVACILSRFPRWTALDEE